ncbi:MAG TPA: hypothetical protein VGU02_07610 [Gaiellaceae bacterium]|nr:hypothetical protein [Gaiellaceae bacterium]
MILVEGFSDQIALETLARRLGADVDVQPIGGAHAIRAALARYPDASGGLCDEREWPIWQRALAKVGRSEDGFHVCRTDLEDELIRAHGVESVEKVLDENGDLATFRAFQNQPAWRGRPVDAQLHRWLGSSDGRHLRYPRLLVDALPLDHMPRPLLAVLETATAAQARPSGSD